MISMTVSGRKRQFEAGRRNDAIDPQATLGDFAKQTFRGSVQPVDRPLLERV
jgi:hypothetical protein